MLFKVVFLQIKVSPILQTLNQLTSSFPVRSIVISSCSSSMLTSSITSSSDSCHALLRGCLGCLGSSGSSSWLDESSLSLLTAGACGRFDAFPPDQADLLWVVSFFFVAPLLPDLVAFCARFNMVTIMRWWPCVLFTPVYLLLYHLFALLLQLRAHPMLANVAQMSFHSRYLNAVITGWNRSWSVTPVANM